MVGHLATIGLLYSGLLWPNGQPGITCLYCIRSSPFNISLRFLSLHTQLRARQDQSAFLKMLFLLHHFHAFAFTEPLLPILSSIEVGILQHSPHQPFTSPFIDTLHYRLSHSHVAYYHIRWKGQVDCGRQALCQEEKGSVSLRWSQCRH